MTKIKPKGGLLLKYNSGIKLIWDGAIALISFCYGFYLPYALSFSHEYVFEAQIAV